MNDYELRELMTEELCKIKWFRDDKDVISLEKGLKLLVKQVNGQEDEMKFLCQEIEELQEENYKQANRKEDEIKFLCKEIEQLHEEIKDLCKEIEQLQEGKALATSS